MPGYPWWARAATLPVSCYRVVQVEAHAPFDRGRLAVLRHTPKVPEGFSSGSQGRSIGPGGSAPPYGGIPFRELSTSLGHDLGHPERSLARAMAMYGSSIVVPDSVVLGWLSKPSVVQPSNP